MSATTMAQYRLRQTEQQPWRKKPGGHDGCQVEHFPWALPTVTASLPNHVRDYFRSTTASTSREVINSPFLPGTSEASTKILDRVLGPRFQKECGEMEEGSEEGCQDCQSLDQISRRRGWGSRAALIWQIGA